MILSTISSAKRSLLRNLTMLNQTAKVLSLVKIKKCQAQPLKRFYPTKYPHRKLIHLTRIHSPKRIFNALQELIMTLTALRSRCLSNHPVRLLAAASWHKMTVRCLFGRKNPKKISKRHLLIRKHLVSAGKISIMYRNIKLKKPLIHR